MVADPGGADLDLDFKKNLGLGPTLDKQPGSDFILI